MTTQQDLWDWLKAERLWNERLDQWLSAESVDPLTLPERRKGHPPPKALLNRATQRARKFSNRRKGS